MAKTATKTEKKADPIKDSVKKVEKALTELEKAANNAKKVANNEGYFSIGFTARMNALLSTVKREKRRLPK